MNLSRLLPLAAVLAAAPLAAQGSAPPKLNLEQETAVRCSAAFAIIASEQARGTPLGATWPALGNRGREFFVRTGARLMDETGATRPQVQALFARSAADLRGPGKTLAVRLEGLRSPCLALLELAAPAG
jgi:hypothetical protein